MTSRRSNNRSRKANHQRRNKPAVSQALVEATIRDLSYEGQGVARINDRTVFVEGGLPDETVQIRYTNHRGKFDQAVVTQVIESSPHRVEPPCPHFAQCGGCQLQHLAVDAQLDYKQQLLLTTLERIGKVIPAEVLLPISAESFQYRRRARLGVRYLAKEDRIELGFRAANSDKVTPLKQCPVLMAPFDSLFADFAELINQLAAKRRIPQLEVMVADSGNAINIHLLTKLQDDDRAKLLAFSEQKGLQVFIQTAGSDTIEPLTENTQPLSYKLPEFNLELVFQPGSFLQVNPKVNEQLVSRAVELLDLKGDETVLDLFCGLSNFTLPIATRAKQVVGVEGNAKAIELAEQNAQKNQLDNCEFFVADLSKDQRSSKWSKRKYDAVVLDPPRSGSVDVLSLVARSGAKKVVYVSCHPGTLARDVGMLVNECGFTLQSASAAEMFPHTAHLESVLLLTR